MRPVSSYRWSRGLIAVAAALTLVGCSSTPAPTFKVVDVAVTQESPEASVVTFVLEGENSGKEPLPLRTVAYSLSLDGKQVFSGTRMAEATLSSSGGTERVKLPVVVPVVEGNKPAGHIPYRLSGSVEYEIPGSIAEYLFDTGLRVPSAGFGESGQLDFGS